MRRTTLHPSPRRLLAATAILAVGAALIPKAFAGIQVNTINPTATIEHQGKKVVLTGPISATAGEKIHLRVTLTQRSTGAVAEGRAKFVATGADETWEVVVNVEGNERFQAGSATAVALAFTTDGQDATDAHQWLVNVTLVE